MILSSLETLSKISKSLSHSNGNQLCSRCHVRVFVQKGKGNHIHKSNQLCCIHTNVYCFQSGVSPDSVVPKTPISVPFDEAINSKFLRNCVEKKREFIIISQMLLPNYSNYIAVVFFCFNFTIVKCE